VLDALKGYSFPGNVRELENILERALAFANDGVIEVGDLALKGGKAGEAAGAAAVADAGGAIGRAAAAGQPAIQPARIPEPDRARHHPARAGADPVQPHPGRAAAGHQLPPAALSNAEAEHPGAGSGEWI
jgi:two-component system response regulator PilR (NtrC family)